MEDKEQEPQQMNLFEKYAIPYYMASFSYLTIWAIHLTTNEPAYSCAFILSLIYFGRFFPNDSYPILHSRANNRNIFQVFPMVSHILLTWTTLAYVFVTYPFKDYTQIQCVQAFLALVYTVPGSLDAAHELIHRPQWAFRALGFANMAVFQFSVYPIEHIYLHHKHVGSQKDPITSPVNQNFYRYLFNAYFSAHKFVFNWSKKAFSVCLAANWFFLGGMILYAFN